MREAFRGLPLLGLALLCACTTGTRPDPKAAAKFASPNKTRIVRKVGTDFQSLTVADVTSGDKSKDVALRPDDVVFIPQTLFCLG